MPASPVETTILPRARDLGDGFVVQRVLPHAARRMVGPFVFFDQMGPVTLRAGAGLDVRPHPHIGLATVTYLFDGEIMHRDSLGTTIAIRPGEVNWMTAGRGIVHSERSSAEDRTRDRRLFGIQSWVALPKAHEETAPAFAHHGADALPQGQEKGVRLRVVAGRFAGLASPVATFSDTLYVDIALAPGGALAIPADQEERAVYIVEGAVTIEGVEHPAGQLLVLAPGATVLLEASAATRLILLGGATMDGPRHIWWNFVSSSQERIEQAKRDWKEDRFAPVRGDLEFIPLPE